VRDRALAALATKAGQRDDLLVFNTLSWQRDDVATATIADPGGDVELVQADGQTTPAQAAARDGNRVQIVFSAGQVPAMGCAAFSVRRAQPAGASVQRSLHASTRRLENRFFLLDLADDGSITRLFDKRAGRDVIAQGKRANVLQLFQDGPEREAAWNVHATYEKREYQWDAKTHLDVIEQGPVRAAVRVSRSYRQNRLEQDIMLYDRLPRIDFVTRVSWQERQVMLKAAFPLEVRSARATYEIQFGAVERPTHRNTSWDQEKFEVCAHQWADLSEAGYGVSLLNDCKYGYDAKDSTLRLTLLRGPQWPDPNADRGDHEFTYALFPHRGDWTEADTVRRGWELNAPLIATTGSGANAHGPASVSYVRVDGPAIVSALKPAEDGNGYILRLYEPNGARGEVHVRLPGPGRAAVECNLAEEPVGDARVVGDRLVFSIRPFEIKTFRVAGGTVVSNIQRPALDVA
jgi:alpha-mannosidase